MSAAASQPVALPGLTNPTPPAETKSCWRTCFLTVIAERIVHFVRDIFLALLNLFRGHPENPLQARVKQLESDIHQVADERNQANAELDKLRKKAEQFQQQLLAAQAAQAAKLTSPSPPTSPPQSSPPDAGDSSDSDTLPTGAPPPHSGSGRTKSPPSPE